MTAKGDGAATAPDGIDAARVEGWFRDHVPGVQPPLRYRLIAGGHSNLTFSVTDAGGGRYVLRRPPLSSVLATAHDMGREHTVIAALQDTPVPVPPVFGLCRDESVTGAQFFVMGYVDGHVLHDAATVEEVLPVPARRAAGERLVDVMAALHTVDIDAVGLGDFGRREGYLQRQLRRWSTQWENSKTRELPEIEQVHAELAATAPEQQGKPGIVHGDLRFGNCLTTSEGDVAAVLDWELCTLGDPLADLGWMLYWWEQPSEPRTANDIVPTRAGSFPTREEVAERYAQRSGRDISRADWYMAFAGWRLACIGEGVYARYVKGAMGEAPMDLDRYREGVDRNARRAAALLS